MFWLLVLLVSVFSMSDAFAISDTDRCKKSSGEEKVRTCTTVINDPNSSDEWIAWAKIHRGNAYAWQLRQYPDAIADFDDVIEYNLNNVSNAWIGKCYARMNMQEHSLAIEECNRAIEIEPSNASNWSTRCDVYLQFKDHESAISDCLRATQIDPHDAINWAKLANLRNHIGEYDDAIIDANRSLSVNHNEFAFRILGYASFFLNNFNDSIYYYSKSLDYPSDLRDISYGGRGAAYHMLGNYNQALIEYNSAIKAYRGGREKDLSSYYANFGSGQLSLGDIQGALSTERIAISIFPSNSDAYYFMALAYDRQGNQKLSQASLRRSVRLQIDPTFSIYFPLDLSLDNLEDGIGVHFAIPAIPETKLLEQCWQKSGDKDVFYECMVEKALPKQYRQVKGCISANSDDLAAAAVCSTDDPNLTQAYKKFKNVRGCVEEGDANGQVASCLGSQFLGPNEQYYVDCVARNQGSYGGMAICALGKDLTPEQQIALNCLVTSGGEPTLYASCVGGQLVTRELNKCWDHGIATEQGCFGPNNEIRRFYDKIDERIAKAFGTGGEGYKLWKLYKENFLTPGKNNEVVKFLNNGLRDLKDGKPGPNNEFVKAGNAVADAFQSLGDGLGL